MAEVTDPETIMEGAKCMECIPPGAQNAAIVYLLGQLAGITDPQAIMANARCFDTCIPAGLQGAAMIYLTDQLT